MSDLISRQALCEYALNQKDKSVTPNDIMRFPSAQPETPMQIGWICPVCGRTLGVSKFVQAQSGLRFGDLHCKRCGQAIDWEDSE